MSQPGGVGPVSAGAYGPAGCPARSAAACPLVLLQSSACLSSHLLSCTSARFASSCRAHLQHRSPIWIMDPTLGGRSRPRHAALRFRPLLRLSSWHGWQLPACLGRGCCTLTARSSVCHLLYSFCSLRVSAFHAFDSCPATRRASFLRSCPTQQQPLYPVHQLSSSPLFDKVHTWRVR